MWWFHCNAPVHRHRRITGGEFPAAHPLATPVPAPRLESYGSCRCCHRRDGLWGWARWPPLTVLVPLPWWAFHSSGTVVFAATNASTAATTTITNLSSDLGPAVPSACHLLCPQAWTCTCVPCHSRIFSAHTYTLLPHLTSLTKPTFRDKIIKNSGWWSWCTEPNLRGGRSGPARAAHPELAPMQGRCADLGGEAGASLQCEPESTLSQGTRRSGLCSENGNPAHPSCKVRAPCWQRKPALRNSSYLFPHTHPKIWWLRPHESSAERQRWPLPGA